MKDDKSAVDGSPSPNPTVHISSSSDVQDSTRLKDDERPMNIQTWLAIAAIATQYIAYGLAVLMPSTIVAYVNADLGPSPNFTWIVVSWSLCASVVVTVGGRLADIFGRRWFLITGAVFGMTGCLVGATGQSINQMIASGVLLGVAGGLQEMCYAAVQEIVPNRHRVFAIGCFELTAMLCFTAPIIAYSMLAKTAPGWRTVYWFLFAWNTLGLTSLFCFYHPPNFRTKHRADGKTPMQLLREFDVLGVVLFAAGCTLFLVGINWGGRQYPWASAHVVSTLVIGIVLLIILGFWSAYSHVPVPFLPPKLFRKVRGFTMILVVSFISGMLFYSLALLWPRESAILFVPPNNLIIAGLYANVLSFGTFLSGVILALICPFIGHERWQLVGFTTLQTAFIGSLASIGIYDKAQAIATVVILGAVVTPPTLLAFVMISLGLDDQVDIGVANGLTSTFRLMGGAIASAIYSAILANRFSTELPIKLAPVIQAHDLTPANAKQLIAAAALGTAAALQKVPGITAELLQSTQLAIKQAYVESFRLVYLVAIGFGVIAIICAAFTRSIPLERKTNHRAVKLENEKSSLVDVEHVSPGIKA